MRKFLLAYSIIDHLLLSINFWLRYFSCHLIALNQFWLLGNMPNIGSRNQQSVDLEFLIHFLNLHEGLIVCELTEKQYCRSYNLCEKFFSAIFHK